MNISIIGTGYVGLVTGACFAELGINVLCMDTDKEKISKLKSGIIPIYEPGLEQIVRKNYNDTKTLGFTTDINEAVEHGQIIFIAVNTPTLSNDLPDLQYAFNAQNAIAQTMHEYKVIVNKSTVPVGTGRRMKENISSILEQRGLNIDFDIVSNPEFLREGSAVNDFMFPERIVVGAESDMALGLIKSIYSTFTDKNIPLLVTNIETSEIIKYASNTFLATKVSFINEIANLCELCDADVTLVSKAMGLDSRIGASFLKPGPGYGGSCFPKDTKAMIGIGKSFGYLPKIVKSAIDVNNKQIYRMLAKILKSVGKLKNKTITVLGVAFKPETNDIRESRSIELINALLKKNAKVKIFDPQAMDNAKELLIDTDVQFCDDIYSACEGSDCIVLATEWEAFCNMDFAKLKSIVNQHIFVDLRNAYEPEYVRNWGFKYQGVGRK